MTPCTGPGPCRRPAVTRGLCDAHRKQRDRGKGLAPLRSGPALPVLSLRVEPEVKAAALANPDGARSALTRWSKRRV